MSPKQSKTQYVPQTFTVHIAVTGEQAETLDRLADLMGFDARDLLEGIAHQHTSAGLESLRRLLASRS